MFARLRHIGCVLAFFMALAHPVLAQDGPRIVAPSSVKSPILVIEPNRLLTGTLLGRRVLAEIEASRDKIQLETSRIEGELIAEEKALTEKREELEADAFRTLADAFDEKAQGFRKETEEREAELAKRIEEAERQILQSALPALQDIMRESGAAIIIDRRSVFLSADVIDVTDRVIQRLDETLGDGLPAAVE